jgi:predicted dehydrogenase
LSSSFLVRFESRRLTFINDFKPVKAGLYGAGAFGKFIAGALAGSLSVRLVAVASRTAARAAVLARDEGISRTHESYEHLLADPELDLVVLATPPGEHGTQARLALDAGKHVFVEKPLATSLEMAEAIIREAKARNLIVAVDYPMIYTPLVEAAALFNSSRLVGPLLRVSVENIASCQGLDDAHWFWDKELSGGIFVEHGVHFFDWCGRFAGDAREVVALANSRGAREDQVFALVRHAGGAVASYHHSFVTRPENERTQTVLSYEGVDVVLDGWIPTRLHMRGPSEAIATTTVRRMLHRSVESVPDARVGFFFDAGRKATVYASGVRAAAEDLARAIRVPGYIARNDAQRTLPSLRVAVAAREAALTGVAVELGPTRSEARP